MASIFMLKCVKFQPKYWMSISDNEGTMVLNLIVSLERAVGVPLVTPELQACAFLYDRGPSPSHHLQGALRTSPAGFHNVKRRLIEHDVIFGTKSPHDARVTLYDLTEHVRRALDARIQVFLGGASPGPSLKAAGIAEEVFEQTVYRGKA